LNANRLVILVRNGQMELQSRSNNVDSCC